jgi:DNA-binding GntR family transcriptional regulator
MRTPEHVAGGGGRRLEPIVSPTLVGTVVETLRTSILVGRFAPGERLVEAEIARELGISRGPIREGLALLEKDGIVVNLPRRGKFVLGFDERLLKEIYSLRKVLEPYAAGLLIASLDDAKEAALRASLDGIQEAADAGDVLLLAQRDVALHSTLYELADHELLRRVWTETIASKLRMLLNITTRTHVPLLDAVTNHREIVEAILAKNARQARSLLAHHIDDAWRRARTALQESDAREPVAAAPPG